MPHPGYSSDYNMLAVGLSRKFWSAKILVRGTIFSWKIGPMLKILVLQWTNFPWNIGRGGTKIPWNIGPGTPGDQYLGFDP